MEKDLWKGVAPQQSGSEKSSWWTLQAVLFSPRAAFSALKERPVWVLPLLLTAAVSLASSTVIFSRVGVTELIKAQLQAGAQSGQVNEAQLEEQARETADNPVVRVMLYVSPLIGPLFIVLAVSVVFWIGLTLAGGEATFLKLLSVTAHTFFLYYLLFSVLAVLVFLLAETPAELDLQNPVLTNLGPLVDAGRQPIANRLLQAIDILVFYHIYLLGLGLSTTVQSVGRKAATLVVTASYAVYVGIGLGWRWLFS